MAYFKYCSMQIANTLYRRQSKMLEFKMRANQSPLGDVFISSDVLGALEEKKRKEK